jgi:hypothetical protein
VGRYGRVPIVTLLLSGHKTAGDVNANNITNIKPLFAPGKEFKKVLNNTDFVKARS